VNRVGDDGTGASHPGASAVLDFMGKPLVELGADPAIATVDLDIEALRAWRDKYPAHLDADAFTLAP
jgi:omega-amidase